MRSGFLTSSQNFSKNVMVQKDVAAKALTSVMTCVMIKIA